MPRDTLDELLASSNLLIWDEKYGAPNELTRYSNLRVEGSEVIVLREDLENLTLTRSCMYTDYPQPCLSSHGLLDMEPMRIQMLPCCSAVTARG